MYGRYYVGEGGGAVLEEGVDREHHHIGTHRKTSWGRKGEKKKRVDLSSIN